MGYFSFFYGISIGFGSSVFILGIGSGLFFERLLRVHHVKFMIFLIFSFYNDVVFCLQLY